MDYLFVGEDSLSKDIKLDKIKQEFLTKELEQFNFDCFYSKELDLLKLQEALLRLPVKAKKRIILIREADKLKENIKEYLIKYFKKPLGHLLLILDANKIDNKNEFFLKAGKYLKALHFRERDTFNTFILSQEIDRRKVNTSLKILNHLLVEGERPERIMGGLRYSWQRGTLSAQVRKRRLLLLLNCDIDIKTGRLKASLALERLIVNLCCF